MKIETIVLIDGEYQDVPLSTAIKMQNVVEELSQRIFVEDNYFDCVESSEIVDYGTWYLVTYHVLEGSVSFHAFAANEVIFWLHFFSSGYSILEIKIEKEK